MKSLNEIISCLNVKRIDVNIGDIYWRALQGKLSFFQYLRSPFGKRPHSSLITMGNDLYGAQREILIPRVSWKPSARAAPNHQPMKPKLQPDTKTSPKLCLEMNYKAKKNLTKDAFFQPFKVFFCGFNHTANPCRRERFMKGKSLSLSQSSALFQCRMKSHFVG